MKKVLDYMEATILILSCSSVFLLTVNRDYHLTEFLIGLSFLQLLFHIFSKDFDKVKASKSIVFLLFYFAWMSIFMILNTHNTFHFLATFCILFPLFYFRFSTSKSNQTIMRILEKIPKIMCVLVFISFIFYFFGSLLNIIHPNGTIVVNWDKIRTFPSYYGLHFNTQYITLFNHNILRNTGIFPESPMYSLNLAFALGIEFFLLKKTSKFRSAAFILAIFTTTSTTGIIVMSFMILAKFLLNNSKEKNKKIYRFLFPVLLVFLFVVCGYFYLEKKQTSSYSTRTDDYKAAYLAWKDHPIIGNGYNDTSSITKYMTYSRGVSNSLVVLSEGGLWLFLVYIIPLIKALRYGMERKTYRISVFGLVLLILFITTTFQFRPILICFLASGFALNKNDRSGIYEKI